MKPLHVAFVSYGNDSLALIQWLHEHGVENVTLAYHDTGWASPEWGERVAAAEQRAVAYGFATRRR